MPTVQFKSFAARYPFCRKSVITPTFSSNPPFWGSLPARGSGWLICPSFLAVIIPYLLFVLQMMLLANPIGNMGVIAWPDHLKFGDCCCAPCLLCRFKRLNLPAVLWNSVEANAAVKMIHAIHFYAKSFLFHVDIATQCKRFERLNMDKISTGRLLPWSACVYPLDRRFLIVPCGILACQSLTGFGTGGVDGINA